MDARLQLNKRFRNRSASFVGAHRKHFVQIGLRVPHSTRYRCDNLGPVVLNRDAHSRMANVQSRAVHITIDLASVQNAGDNFVQAPLRGLGQHGQRRVAVRLAFRATLGETLPRFLHHVHSFGILLILPIWLILPILPILPIALYAPIALFALGTLRMRGAEGSQVT